VLKARSPHSHPSLTGNSPLLSNIYYMLGDTTDALTILMPSHTNAVEWFARYIHIGITNKNLVKFLHHFLLASSPLEA
jgi:hypothetical protein